ncbi:MAG TPA: AfsR/SARP family transcriptional regulator, partial [Amycolatopsis sp.]|nr:AfsR/SARP family transcriptional regulator [Amycolatopsis sp.]
LDNCEHVIEAAAAFAHRLLGECRRLRILATSREPLGITGETLWHVVPLAVPDRHAGPGEIEASPAVRLLRDRASAVRKDFVADEATLATMARVCRVLDGMPLAIELAAARLRTMSVDQLANRLDDRFRLLTGGSRTALPRHRTLRAMVDWSWELLSDAERTVLCRLSVFTGGASLEAAEQVCVSEAVEQYEVLELLTALTEKSLLVAAGDEAPRYRMLGTIKEYAAQRLAEAGETVVARHAHLACFTALAEAAEPMLRRAEQLEWLAELKAEHDNITSAMRGALAAGEAPEAMRLAAACGWYWWLSGHRTEGMELVSAAVRTPGEVSDDVAAVVHGLVSLFVSSGFADENTAAKWIHESYRLGTRSEHKHPLLGLVVPLERMLNGDEALSAWEPVLEDENAWVRALGRLHLGKMRITLGHPGREADEYLEQALKEFRALGERFGISFALTELADRIATRGEFATACEYYEEAVTVVTEVGSVEDLIRLRARQAQLYWLMDDEEACAAAVAEAQRYSAQVTWPGALGMFALSQAELFHWRGETEEAAKQLAFAMTVMGDEAGLGHVRAISHDLQGYFTEDLEESRAHREAAWQAAAEVRHVPLIAHMLVGIAELALRQDDPEQAARLLGAADELRGLPDRSRPDVTRIERTVLRRLGEANFAEAAREGTKADWKRLVEVTLAS